MRPMSIRRRHWCDSAARPGRFVNSTWRDDVVAHRQPMLTGFTLPSFVVRDNDGHSRGAALCQDYVRFRLTANTPPKSPTHRTGLLDVVRRAGPRNDRAPEARKDCCLSSTSPGGDWKITKAAQSTGSRKHARRRGAGDRPPAYRKHVAPGIASCTSTSGWSSRFSTGAV